jgi:hypothetical protein
MRRLAALCGLMLVTVTATAAEPSASPAAATSHGLDAAAAARLAKLALDCVHREYPNKLSHVLNSADDVRAPHELTPAFYGCYDWHSAVHGHWLLVRLAKSFPTEPFAAQARAALDESLASSNIAAEVAYMKGGGRASFERPYGIAWLLALAAELRSWNDPQAQTWSVALEPLEVVAALRLAQWIPKLHYPIRIGEHDQTAFSFGLILDWAAIARREDIRVLVSEASRDFYAKDRACPMAYEPSGQDFLSPCLSEADLMRRVLDAQAYATWLTGFLPGIPRDGKATWLAPGVVTDRADPKLAHLDGLNLSRAWMLQGIASGLPAGDKRIPALRAAAVAHANTSLPAVASKYYVGSHWLGTFAVYLLTR